MSVHGLDLVWALLILSAISRLELLLAKYHGNQQGARFAGLCMWLLFGLAVLCLALQVVRS